MPWVDFNTTSEDTKQFVHSAQKQYLDRNGFHCCIKYREKIVGIVGLHRIDWINKTGELAYWLGEQYQGKGIMTKCCKALTEYAFDELRIDRVEILANNFKSCAISKRLGFIKENTLVDAEWINDRFVNNIVYSMSSIDWSS